MESQLRLLRYNTTILGNRRQEYCSFLTIGPQSCGFGNTMTPPPTPPWSILFGWGDEMIQPDFNKVFLGEGEGNAFIISSAILKLDIAMSIFGNIFVQDCNPLSIFIFAL